MLYNNWPFVLMLLAAMVLTVVTKKLTVSASVVAGICGVAIYAGAGYTGIAMVAVFFTLGTFATRWKLNVKQAIGVAEENKGQRTAGQVIANAGVAAILGLLAYLNNEYVPLLQLMIAGSLASATADTLSSEMGNVYGRRYYNILSFKRDIRGRDGVVSLEGTLIGLLGSMVIAAVYAFGSGLLQNLMYVVAAGTLGNIADSILGATVERKGYLNNNAVNYLNTDIGAVAAALFYIL
jgi:uncharacterized protein (TIGR00297 family)